MAKNWQNSGFVAKCLTKIALFDERKMAFWRQNPLKPSYTATTSRQCQIQHKQIVKLNTNCEMYKWIVLM